jgi:hypothetical protein
LELTLPRGLPLGEASLVPDDAVEADVIDRRLVFAGRSFATTLDLDSGPVWEPLEDVARLVSLSPELPQFHPVEFMCMATVRSRRQRLAIRLYKHMDTRRYLNLDDAGHAYAFVPSDPERCADDFGGRYRRYTNLVDAIERLGLWQFDAIGLHRSFRPEDWPGAS